MLDASHQGGFRGRGRLANRKANVGSCEDGAIEGVIIDTISAWNGVRIRFDLVVGELTRARVVGISASAPPGAIEQPAHVTIT